jgi:hypothetical protein
MTGNTLFFEVSYFRKASLPASVKIDFFLKILIWLTNNKRPPGDDPSGLEVCGLNTLSNVSINNKPIFLS